MGGFLLPFLTQLGRFSEPFDFRLPGVTSMSADVHKYGYASKGVSVILYRTHELARHQIFATSDWLGGFYASTAMAGTRPAGPIAAAWAVAHAYRRERLPRAHAGPRTTPPWSSGPGSRTSAAWSSAGIHRQRSWHSVHRIRLLWTSLPSGRS